MFKKVFNHQKVNEKVMYATVDIGKSKNFGYYRCSDGHEIKPFPFGNDTPGFNKFRNKIFYDSIRHNVDRIIIGFESTGNYGVPFVHYMDSEKDNFMVKNVDIVQINPSHTKKLKDVRDNSPNKTDQKDPKVIADIIQWGCYLSVVIPKGAAANLRALTNNRESEIKDRTVSINRLEKLVFEVFPEHSKIFKGIDGKTSFYLLEKYTLPGAFRRLGVKRLTKIIRRISRGRCKEEHAEKLIMAAKSPAGIHEGVQFKVMQIRRIISKIREIDIYLESIKKDMEKQLEAIPVSKHILSIKGVGIITTSYIIGQLGDIEAFTSQKALIKFAGLNLYEISSGKHRGQKHISKRGRPLIRKILYFAALGTVKKNGIMHDYYHRLVDRGMKKPKALVAVSRKLLRIMFALARDKTDYIHNYSQLKSAA